MKTSHSERSSNRKRLQSSLDEVVTYRDDIAFHDLWFILWRCLPTRTAWSIITGFVFVVVGAISIGVFIAPKSADEKVGPENRPEQDDPRGQEGGRSSVEAMDIHHEVVAGIFGVHFSFAKEDGNHERLAEVQELVVRAYTYLGFDPQFYGPFLYGDSAPEALRAFVTIAVAQEAGRRLGPEASSAVRFGSRIALIHATMVHAINSQSEDDLKEIAEYVRSQLPELRALAESATLPDQVSTSIDSIEVTLLECSLQSMKRAREELGEIYGKLMVTDHAVRFLQTSD